MLGLTFIVEVSLFSVNDLFVIWLSLEWLSVVCLLSFVAPEISLTTGFISPYVPIVFWPSSRHWLWTLTIAFNVVAVVKTVRWYGT